MWHDGILDQMSVRACVCVLGCMSALFGPYLAVYAFVRVCPITVCTHLCARGDL